MPRLRVLISRPGEGRSVLRCVRANRAETWQKQERHAALIVTHDLTHFAVGSMFGYLVRFLRTDCGGLGWDIADTTG